MARRPSSSSIGLANSPEIARRNGSASFNPPKRDSNHLGDAARRPAPRTASSSQKLDSSVNFNDIDPDDLFTKYTVSEIRTVQHRLR